MGNKQGLSKEQREKARAEQQAQQSARRGRPSNTASNRQKRLERDAKRKQTHKAHPHDAERRALREKWMTEARKTSDRGWVPSWPVWLSIHKASQEGEEQ